MVFIFFIMLISFVFVIFSIWRSSKTDYKLPRGALSLESPPENGQYLMMKFEYAGGGSCKVRAIAETDFILDDFDRNSSFMVFLLDQHGVVTDYHIGTQCFASSDKEDWLSLKRQIEYTWRQYQKEL